MAKKKSTINIDNDSSIIVLESEDDELEKKIETPEDIRKRIARDIKKDFGNGVMIDGNEMMEKPRLLIPVCPSVNRITGGGIPEGSWVILSGKEKSGKTHLSLHFAKRCQTPEYGFKNIYFLNVEGRLKKRDLIGASGLNFDSFTIIESTEDRILTTEDYLTIASNILYTDKRCVIIIDSISQLCEGKVQEKGVGTQTRGGNGVLVSQFTSTMGPVVNVKNSILIGILQHRHNTSGYGGPIEKGGWAIQYQVDVKLVVQGTPKPLSVTESSPPYGQITTWKCFSTATNFPPLRSCETYIRYGEGIDEEQELINDAKEIGLLTPSGKSKSWVILDFLKNHLDEIGLKEWNEDVAVEIGARANGLENTRALLKEHPDWMAMLQKDILAMD